MKHLNYSRQREALKENLSSRYDHPTADTLYQSLRKDDPHISLGTVYRNLSLLHTRGEVLKFPGPDGNDRYDGHADPHDHFICRFCGKIIDLPRLSLPENFPSEEAAVIDSQILYGICMDCK